MSREIYAALSGARSAWRQIEVVGNNISNVNTTGYKSSRMVFRAIGPENFDPNGQMYATPDEVQSMHVDGVLEQTGNPAHLALQGLGWFTVETPVGQRLTRDGRFGLDPEGTLVNGQGYPVLGQGGTIQIPPGERLHITEEGKVFGSETGELDQLALVRGEAVQEGGNLWRPVGEMAEGQPRVLQGALESSNVDPMRSMVELIQASRTFEAFQKVMQASDEADARLNEIGGAA